AGQGGDASQDRRRPRTPVAGAAHAVRRGDRPQHGADAREHRAVQPFRSGGGGQAARDRRASRAASPRPRQRPPPGGRDGGLTRTPIPTISYPYAMKAPALAVAGAILLVGSPRACATTTG